MKSVTYQYCLQRTAELTGRVYEKLTLEDATRLRGHIALAMRRIWEKFPWPETLRYQEERFANLWDAEYAYYPGFFVFHPASQKYYQCVNSNTGLAPCDDSGLDTNKEAWAVATANPAATQDYGYSTSYTAGDVVRNPRDGLYYYVFVTGIVGGDIIGLSAPDFCTQLVPFIRRISKVSGFDSVTPDVRSLEIGEILGVWATDPRATFNKQPIDIEFYDDGIIVRDAVASVWVLFRKVPDDLATDPTSIPYRFSEVVAQQAAAMSLALEGKLQLAEYLNTQAEIDLQNECDKVNSQEGQVYEVKVITR